MNKKLTPIIPGGLALFNAPALKLFDKQQKAVEQMIQPLRRQQEAYAKMAKPLRQQQAAFTRALKPLWQQQEAFAKMIEPLRQQQKALKPLWHLQETIAKLEQFHVTAPTIKIPNKQSIKIDLAIRLWPTSDTDLINHLTQDDIGGKKNLNSRITTYHRENDWKKLGALVEKWNNFPYVKDRLPILEDCFKTLKLLHPTDINVANVIVPTLICQFEGIIQEGCVSKKEEFWTLPPRMLNEQICFLGIVAEVFGNSHEFERAKQAGENTIDLNRHKINHGDKMLLDYGTDENLVRLFLYINEAIRHVASSDEEAI